MKITNVQATTLKGYKDWNFVRIETDEGVMGHGEAHPGESVSVSGSGHRAWVSYPAFAEPDAAERLCALGVVPQPSERGRPFNQECMTADLIVLCLLAYN